MKLSKVPKIGDIIKFKLKHTFICTSFFTDDTAMQEAEVGTLAEVVDRSFHQKNSSIGGDSVIMDLVLSFYSDKGPVFFKLEYNIHGDKIEIVGSEKTAKILFEFE